MPLATPLFAVVTPFDSQGAIDGAAFKEYLAFLQDKGVRSIVVGGTTGEFPSLDLQERRDLFTLARTAFGGQIIQNISSCTIADCRSLIASSAGADAFLILPPYYFAAKDEGLRSFFAQALSGVSTPTYLYNFPKHTGVSLSPALVQQLCEDTPAIKGVKDSGGDFEASCAYRAVGADFEIYVGRDTMALEALRRGLSGSVTGASNGLPEYLVALTKAWHEGNEAKAQEIQNSFDIWNTFRRDLGDEIALVKTILALRLKGFPTHVRPPLRPLPEETRQKATAFLNEHNRKL